MHILTQTTTQYQEYATTLFSSAAVLVRVWENIPIGRPLKPILFWLYSAI